jgi:hypothetical protein
LEGLGRGEAGGRGPSQTSARRTPKEEERAMEAQVRNWNHEEGVQQGGGWGNKKKPKGQRGEPHIRRIPGQTEPRSEPGSDRA